MLLLLLPVLLQSSEAATPGGHGGLGRIAVSRASPGDGCVSAETLAWIAEKRREHERLHGPLSTPGPDGPGTPYPFYPLGATHNEDAVIAGFADLDPAPASFHDFECGPNTYDGHDASDTPIRSFEEQWIGVPVVAALDGTVFFARDGNPDMNLNGSADPGNFVAVDHGNGREAHYFHLRNGSVTVSAGQTVRAGQQIGLAASSGNSFYPHLHFATYDSGAMVEPFAGASNEFVAAGAPAGASVHFLYSLALGSTAIPGCPGAAVLLQQPGLLGSRSANAAGRATLALSVPGIAAGRTAHFQAVHLGACAPSNLMTWEFP
jgi:hypothetical protein